MNQIYKVEKMLKSCLKERKRITMATLVAYMISGSFAFASESGSTINGGRITSNDSNVMVTEKGEEGNKATVIDIAEPKEGISHNSYQRLDIEKNDRVILNNFIHNRDSLEEKNPESKILKDFSLIGVNEGLSRGENIPADLIINEVNGGSTASHLEGELEIYGKKADLIIANENGISVNGQKFHNTGDVLLTTEKNVREIYKEKELKKHNFNNITEVGKDIEIIGEGIKFPNQDNKNLKLVGNKISVTGKIGEQGEKNGNIELYSTGTTEKKGKIDITGSMYGNRIVLKTFEDSEGITQNSEISANEISIDAKTGKITIGGNVEAKEKVDIITSSNPSDHPNDRILLEVTKTGVISSDKNVTITTNSVDNINHRGNIRVNGNNQGNNLEEKNEREVYFKFTEGNKAEKEENIQKIREKYKKYFITEKIEEENLEEEEGKNNLSPLEKLLNPKKIYSSGKIKVSFGSEQKNFVLDKETLRKEALEERNKGKEEDLKKLEEERKKQEEELKKQAEEEKRKVEEKRKQDELKRQQQEKERKEREEKEAKAYTSTNIVVDQTKMDAKAKTTLANDEEALKLRNEGTTIVNIAAESSDGISHNEYTKFTIPKDTNVLLNNYTEEGLVKSKLVSKAKVSKNENLNGKSVDIILNEVNHSNNREVTELAGGLEVLGKTADVIIANENGITVNGGKFENTGRLALSTGKFLGKLKEKETNKYLFDDGKSDITITSDFNSNKLELNSKDLNIKSGIKVFSKFDFSAKTAQDINNKGEILGENLINLEAKRNVDNSGNIKGKQVFANSGETLTNQKAGRLESKEVIDIKVKKVINDKSTIYFLGEVRIEGKDSIENKNHSIIRADKYLTLQGDMVHNRISKILSGDDLIIKANKLVNEGTFTGNIEVTEEQKHYVRKVRVRESFWKSWYNGYSLGIYLPKQKIHTKVEDSTIESQNKILISGYGSDEKKADVLNKDAAIVSKRNMHINGDLRNETSFIKQDADQLLSKLKFDFFWNTSSLVDGSIFDKGDEGKY